ncbi:unnamed protein product [Spirodela intermedia]|uniref:FHA domain-containing protein n=1 Tax=Spirodela intermedia TaxID=51605 RepID=A0A7I8IAT4_SPIIN|nr:unnamed protein product [Spirodela intermedia]CAA6654514.1 unnamed protein product [Spirodela intermedia]
MAAAAPAAAVVLSYCRGERRPLRPLHLPSAALVSSSPAIPSLCLRCSPSVGQSRGLSARARGLGRRSTVAVAKSPDAEGAPQPSERWLLDPIGDGDTKHLGFRVPMPNAFEMVSNAVTVGRLPEKADMVIPVATVSGIHARLEKKDGLLLVTDLDSTNGTYINEKRLRPGAISPVPPGSRITFGDTHLAMFRVSKLQEKNIEVEAADSDTEAETEASQIASAS